MKKFSLVTTLAATALLCGCNTPNHIEGSLALSSNLVVKNTDGKQVTVPKGTYNTTVEMNSNGGAVEIHLKQGEVIFAVPKLVADSSGNIGYSAAQLGQVFSLQGKIYDAREGIDRVVNGSCVLGSHQEYKCNGTNADGTQNCDWESVNDYGNQDVHETGYQDTKVVDLAVVQKSTLGKFQGSYAYSEVIQSSEAVSACR
jgi:major membrane immunogen (membrane-anchored lipoprotein)